MYRTLLLLGITGVNMHLGVTEVECALICLMDPLERKLVFFIVFAASTILNDHAKLDTVSCSNLLSLIGISSLHLCKLP